jgi:hypothetical protein
MTNLRPSRIYPNCDFWFENKPATLPEITLKMIPKHTTSIYGALLKLKNRLCRRFFVQMLIDLKKLK